MRNNQIQGENVRLSFNTTGPGTASSVAINVYDVNGVSRPIATNERLILDSFDWGVASGSGLSNAGWFLINDPATTGTVTAANQLDYFNASLGSAENTPTANKEGLVCRPGITPSIIGDPNGSAPSGTNIYFIGQGRVVATTPQGQASWQAAPSRGTFA